MLWSSLPALIKGEMKVHMVKILYFLLFHSNKKGMELVPWVDPDAILRTKVIPDLEVCLSALFNTTLHMKFIFSYVN